jgi:hypothetical protein
MIEKRLDHSQGDYLAVRRREFAPSNKSPVCRTLRNSSSLRALAQGRVGRPPEIPPWRPTLRDWGRRSLTSPRWRPHLRPSRSRRRRDGAGRGEVASGAAVLTRQPSVVDEFVGARPECREGHRWRNGFAGWCDKLRQVVRVGRVDESIYPNLHVGVADAWVGRTVRCSCWQCHLVAVQGDIPAGNTEIRVIVYLRVRV